MPFADHALLVVLAALILDAVIGDPDALWRRWPHPVALMGGLIGFLDRHLNRETDTQPRRRALGVLALAVLIGIAGSLGWAVEALLAKIPHGWIGTALLASTLIAQKSLYQHVARVRDGFATGGLAGGRHAVAMIVGRDPESLDEAGVCRAAIESTAENFSDGIVAPVFWLALLGLPGLFVYKAVNTADSMIGHRTARHEAFGWASARCDDVLNFFPARLAGLLVAFGGIALRKRPGHAVAVMLRDAPLHRSPNAGWPESAMAASLGLALAGPRRYGDRVVDDPFLHAEGRRGAVPEDIERALKVFVAACLANGAVYGVLLVFLPS